MARGVSKGEAVGRAKRAVDVAQAADLAADRAADQAAVDAAALLDWYDRNRRDLPWRAGPGRVADPYHVWLSEIMLQQTTVAAVAPYFARFLEEFPDVAALAAAPHEAVMRAWAGLGYYARARNLHACAKQVAALGGFPRDHAGLQALPGIGPYTARAIAAIAFGVAGVAVDGNVERVLARRFAITTALPAAKGEIGLRAEALAHTPLGRARPGDLVQALFDLGAGPCGRRPACVQVPHICPWSDRCAGLAAGLAASLPRKPPKAVRPRRAGAVFWLEHRGQVLLQQRPARGLLGGMMQLPTTNWDTGGAQASGARASLAAGAAEAGIDAELDWQDCGEVTHVFTHFELRLRVYAARSRARARPAVAAGAIWQDVAVIGQAGLPSVMRKCARLAQAAFDQPRLV